jgi:hypothetical protein
MIMDKLNIQRFAKILIPQKEQSNLQKRKGVNLSDDS